MDIKNIIKYMFFCIIPFLLSNCYTKLYIPDNDSKNEINNKIQMDSNKGLVVIDEEYSFYKTTEDLLRNKFKFGAGIYYMFDFENYIFNY